MMMDHWPFLGLRVRIADLELRLPTEDELADLAAEGVHRPDERPFLWPWTDLPPAERAREVVQRHWRRLGSWSPQDWVLELAVFENGHPIGVQDVRAEAFAIRREVSTGSWLGLKHQGRGIGRQVRSAALHLVFAGLDATQATTMSFTDNAAPLAISRKLGYQPDGITRDVLHDRVVVSQRLRLTRTQWEQTDRPTVTVSGLEPCLIQFGANQPELV
jgi:RimJ/RimL family protein N-acetyltransferase